MINRTSAWWNISVNDYIQCLLLQQNEFKSETHFTENSFKKAKKIMELGECSAYIGLLLLKQLHIL